MTREATPMAAGKVHRWPDAVRERAEDLARDRDLNAAAIRAAIVAELQADVPLETVSRWAKELRRREPIDRASVLRDVADRASCLLSAELDRLERQTSKQRDLSRLDQIARTLKTLSTIEPGKPGAARQTLADLSGRGAAPAAPENPAVRRAA